MHTHYTRAALALAAGLCLTSGAAHASTVGAISYGTVTENKVDFENFPNTDYLVSQFDNIVTIGQMSFGKKFTGQTVSGTPLESLSGVPTGGLNLEAGPANQNLSIGSNQNVIPSWGLTSLVGCGPLTCSEFDGVGEGSVAAKFAGGVATFGFEVAFADAVNGASVFIDVFDTAGGSLGSFTQTVFRNPLFNVTQVAFGTVGGEQSIGGFSVYNNDPGGVGFDNFVYGAVAGGGNDPMAPVPLPASLPLLALGLAAFGVMRRKA